MIDFIRWLLSRKKPNFIRINGEEVVQEQLLTSLGHTTSLSIHNFLIKNGHHFWYFCDPSKAYSHWDHDNQSEKFDSVLFCEFPGPTVRAGDAWHEWLITSYQVSFKFLDDRLVDVTIVQVSHPI